MAPWPSYLTPVFIDGLRGGWLLHRSGRACSQYGAWNVNGIGPDDVRYICDTCQPIGKANREEKWPIKISQNDLWIRNAK